MVDSGGSRRGAANVQLILAILAVISVGGLIFWLNATAEPTQVEFEPEDTATAEPVSDVPIVDLESVRMETSGYLGYELEMRNHEINSLLGDQAFWIGPEDNPFLVKMDSTALEQRGSVETEQTVSVRGSIREMSDSILDLWEEQGVIEGEGERAVASFAEYFLEASQVRDAEEDGGGDGDGGQDQEGQDQEQQDQQDGADGADAG